MQNLTLHKAMDTWIDFVPEARYLSEEVDSGTEGVDSGAEGVDSGTEGADSGTEGADSGTEEFTDSFLRTGSIYTSSHFWPLFHVI
jgi:hypothetical protein